MNIKNKKIAIVGGGPGGLTLARLLQQKKCDITVYDRDLNKAARVQGANLDLHKKSGLLALKKANLLNDFYANYLPNAGKLRVMGNDGKIYIDDHSKKKSKEDRPEIDRGPLRKILLNSLHKNTVVWDSHFLSMKKEKKGWILYFKNGKQAYADIVIGADGANSKVRANLTDIQPIYSGITIIEGNIKDAKKNTPNIYNLLKGGKIFAFGNDQSLILSTKGDGSIAFYTGEKVSENWVKECGINFKNLSEVRKWFNTDFEKWNKKYHELFSTENITITPRPQYHYPFDQSWKTQDNLTLIGDAAHRMPPYAGEGVNMAMLDALKLSESLTNPSLKNTKNAIAKYEKEMLTRVSKIGRETLYNTRWMHEPKALNQMVDFFGTNPLKGIWFLVKSYFNVHILSLFTSGNFKNK
ncbi:monooxygenase; possible 2-polyprenyl-6-methoxyphenol hydroxylase [unidentified eubacterium SCB49]|nr:monooxygenase; possible 2-polyprenyl-6-methoxyphenol hydroxylase [unidentified eubacterium SCB49]